MRDYNVRGRWIFINTTNYDIKYPYTDSIYNLKPNETRVFEEGSEGPKYVDENSYEPLVRPYVVIYGNTLCDTLAGKEGPLEMQNYTSKKLEDRYYEFTYTYTLNDVSKADTCQ